MATHAITDLAIVLKPNDDVAIAKREIAAGTVREDGRVGTRSYVAIISRVNCSASVSQFAMWR